MRPFVRLAVAVSIVLFSGSSMPAATLRPTGKTVPGEVVVKIRNAASANDIAALEKLADADQSKRLAKLSSGTLFRMHSKSKAAEAVAAALEHNPNVEYVEPNYVVRLAATPNDSGFGQLWGLKNTGQVIGGVAGSAGADIDAEAAWNVTTGSASVVVGVVDTGIDYTHPDLAANIWSNPGGKGNAGCAAGTHGFNAITGTCDPMDDHNHGTHVAGTIGAAGNNGTGVAGVNWTASIMGLKFLGADGYGTTADAIAAIDFAVQARIDGVNVRVLSNSWGGGPFSKALLDEINKANEHDILFVAAAGNDGASNDIYPHYPSNYATPNMISVAATDNRDGLAYFTNLGPTTVHLAAPGVSVLSTIPGGGYSSFSGTSMATPHVSGVAALLLAKTPSLTTAQVKSAILDGVDPLAVLSGRCITGGRLNAAKALGVAGTPDFTLAVSPASRSVVRGGSTSFTVTIAPANGFTGPVNLSVTGMQAGHTATFTPSSTTSTSTLVVTAHITASTGIQSTLAITGTSGALTRTAFAMVTTVSAAPASVCPSFSAVTSHPTSGPNAVTIGDFNRDGSADFANVETAANRVRIWLGPSLQSSTTVAVGTTPLFIVNGDFNGDGKPDLATANSGSHNVSILAGNGDGTFQSPGQYLAGTSPFGLAAADLDADGDLDLAVANNGGGNVSVLLGAGDGTFAAASNYAAGSGPFWVIAADVDRDGKLDLAVANYNAGTVSLLRGNGNGTFQSPLDAAAGTRPSSVAAGDFDRDGLMDLAVSNYGSSNVSLLLGNGNGTFDAPVNFAVGLNPYSVATADFNADGRPDLVTANSEAGTISILLSSGNGTFLPALPVSVPAGPTHAAAADLNGDGRTDIAVANSSYVTIVRNLSGCEVNCGTVDNAGTAHYGTGVTPESVATGDFNGDGITDAVTVNSGNDAITISLGTGNGQLAAGVTVNAGSAPHGVATGDFNRDGKLDLAISRPAADEVAILAGNGDGTFQSAAGFAAGDEPRSLAAGDFNRDGKLDLALATRGSDAVTIVRGNGDGTFQAPVSFGAGTDPEAVAVGDFNRDGKLDLAVANRGASNVSILLGNGDGTFQTAAHVDADVSPYAVIAADLNQDGRLDLAVGNSGSNRMSVLIGNGNGTFKTAVHYTAGSAVHGVIAGDLNADGRLDLAAVNYGSHTISFFFAIEGGVFASAVHSGTGNGPVAVAGGDFNRDGKLDLAVANQTSGTVSILINTCPTPDLIIAKSHSGSFTAGQTGTYTITVTNVGAMATSATVAVVEDLPYGLNPTNISGSGWTCTLSPLSCTRSDALAGGASYPAITLTVRVAGSAETTLTNNVIVSGGGEVNTLNNTASDPTGINAITDLLIAKSHSGSFSQGATSRAYTLIVKNVGRLATSGTVTVTDILPAGLTATGMDGLGWSCTVGSLTCVRSDSLAGGGNYPPITVTVNVAGNAPFSVTNTATVSGGADANAANNTASDATVIWSGQTCGSFSSPAYYGGGYYGVGLAVADFNGDGKRDAATSNYYLHTVSVVLGAGDGTFSAPINNNVPTYPRRLAAGDLDNDGDVDLLTTTEYGSTSRVSILLGNGDGTFATATHLAVGTYWYLSGLALADLNRDGALDVVATDPNSRVWVLLGNGDGTLRAAVSYNTLQSAYSIAVADLDGNGTADLVVGTYGGLSIFRGNGDGTFQTATQQSGSDTTGSIAVGDFNHDGVPDLALAIYYYGVRVLTGRGDGTFNAAVSLDTFYGHAHVTVADINADGNDDVVSANSNYGYVVTFLGNGNGTFQTGANTVYAGYPTQVEVSDFNGDGKADLAMSRDSSPSLAIMLGGCADLRLTKSHNGNFRGGQTNATYTLTVRNVGAGASRGTITVKDQLPAGLTATSIFASSWEWECTLATVSCTTNSTMPTGVDGATISVVVTVSNTAAAQVTNTATISGGGDIDPSNNSASDPTTIVHAADLTVTKTHVGTFAPGINGAYTITVGNAGSGPTSGVVTVIDALPPALSAVSMSGTGWNCTLGNRSCTRSDALAATAAYPPITLIVSVADVFLSTVTNVVSVSGGGEVVTSNNSATDLTRILIAPANVVATATSISQATVTWNMLPNVTSYEVWRKTGTGAYVRVGTTVSSLFLDSSLAANTTYFYRVRALDGAVAGPLSLADLTMTFAFADDPVQPRSTRVKALHIQQLRTAANILRAAAGLAPASFTDANVAARFRIKAAHLTEIRAAINEARSALGIPPVSFTDPALTRVRIKTIHLTELRGAVK